MLLGDNQALDSRHMSEYPEVPSSPESNLAKVIFDRLCFGLLLEPLLTHLGRKYRLTPNPVKPGSRGLKPGSVYAFGPGQGVEPNKTGCSYRGKVPAEYGCSDLGRLVGGAALFCFRYHLAQTGPKIGSFGLTEAKDGQNTCKSA